MNERKSWMSDMETSLADDADGRFLQDQKNALIGYSNDLTRAMGQGMDMRGLQRHMEMKKAADTAVTVLENVWRKLRSGGN